MTVIQASVPSMRPYTIDLPHHVLRFSLPEEIAKEMTPLQVEKRFDPNQTGALEGGFRQIAGHLFDFKGPFWVGAYGSLKFHFMVQERMPEFAGDITTVEGLERYVRQWNATIERRAIGCDFSRAVLNGMLAVRREWNTFSDPREREPEDFEIFSLPLSDEFFLDVGFHLKAWDGGRGKERKWKGKAEALRDAIKASIVLESKTIR